jgi:hypothetical protein
MARRLRLHLDRRLDRLEESASLFDGRFPERRILDPGPESVAAVLDAIGDFGEDFVADHVGDENLRELLTSDQATQ